MLDITGAELAKAAKPLLDLLKEKCDARTNIIVSQFDVRVVKDDLRIPAGLPFDNCFVGGCANRELGDCVRCRFDERNITEETKQEVLAAAISIKNS